MKQFAPFIRPVILLAVICASSMLLSGCGDKQPESKETELLLADPLENRRATETPQHRRSALVARPAAGRDFIVLETSFTPASGGGAAVLDLVLVDATDGRLLQVLPMVPLAPDAIDPREHRSIPIKVADGVVVSNGARLLAYNRINSRSVGVPRHATAYAWELGTGRIRLAQQHARVLALLGEAGDQAALLVKTDREATEEFQIRDLVTGEVVFRKLVEYEYSLRAYTLGSTRYAIFEVDGGRFMIWDHVLRRLRPVVFPAGALANSQRWDALMTESPNHLILSNDERWLAFTVLKRSPVAGRPAERLMHVYPLFDGEASGESSKAIRLTAMTDAKGSLQRPAEVVLEPLGLLPGPREDEIVVMTSGLFTLINLAERRTIAEWAAVRWMARREDACEGALRSTASESRCKVTRQLWSAVGIRTEKWRYDAEARPLDGTPVVSWDRRWLATWDRYADHAVVWDLSAHPPVESSPARADDSNPRTLPLSRPEHGDRLVDERVYRDTDLSFSRWGSVLLGVTVRSLATPRGVDLGPQGTVSLVGVDGKEIVSSVDVPGQDFFRLRAANPSHNDHALCAANFARCSQFALRGLNGLIGEEWLVTGCFEGGQPDACMQVADRQDNAPEKLDDSLLARALLCPGGVAGESPSSQQARRCELLRNARHHLPPAAHWQTVCVDQGGGRCRAAAILVDQVLGDPDAAAAIVAAGCERGDREACPLAVAPPVQIEAWMRRDPSREARLAPDLCRAFERLRYPIRGEPFFIDDRYEGIRIVGQGEIVANDPAIPFRDGDILFDGGWCANQPCSADQFSQQIRRTCRAGRNNLMRNFVLEVGSTVPSRNRAWIMLEKP
jgi:hypothetical protein